MLRKTPDWSVALPAPLLLPKVTTLRTLEDVRRLLDHLPAECRTRKAWRQAALLLVGTAYGVADPADVSAALQLAFALDGGECRPAAAPATRVNRPRRAQRTPRPQSGRAVRNR